MQAPIEFLVKIRLLHASATCLEEDSLSPGMEIGGTQVNDLCAAPRRHERP
jgi:hypothetical protein